MVFDAIIVGAGFGGLGAALGLVERGWRVALLEALNYPGGCASTFQRDGHRFEAGATLVAGLGEGQLFRRWIDRHQLPLRLEPLDPAVELRTPGWRLVVPADRAGLVEALARRPGAPRDALERFFAEQRRVADALWPLLDRPEGLPPVDPRRLPELARRGLALRAALPHVGRPLMATLERFGLGRFEPLVVYLDALCQITLQCGVREAEAPFALATMDYWFRGAAHVEGGLGALAWALAGAIERGGGELRFAERARGIERRAGGGFRVHTRRGSLEAPVVVANLLPAALSALAPIGARGGRRLAARQRRVERGWGASMLYLVTRPGPASPARPAHLELVADPARPLVEGNHLFCSMGDAEPDGARPVTVSTHLDLRALAGASPERRAARVAAVQQRMRDTLSSLGADWLGEVEHELTASPRTFERFTRRPGGWVGGVPRRAGLGAYDLRIPFVVEPGLLLVGDSVFPGQSTLAVAAGGLKTAEVLHRRAGARR